MNELGVPTPDSDVVNKEPKVLLIGFGWVGQYMGKYFTKAHYTDSSGLVFAVSKPGKEVHPLKEYDLAIISTPTPMNEITGQCDTSIVEQCVIDWKHKVKTFLVKSTVEIGTCERLEKDYNVNVCMSPEYVGETLGHPLLEPRRDAFQIIGGNPQAREEVADMFMQVLTADAPIHLVTHTEAEIIKYCENYWIMRRVDYWNDVMQVCAVHGQSYQKVREGLVLDPRMDRTHSNVYKNNRGWSGKCLPKDMNALAHTMRKNGVPLHGLEMLIEKNAKYWRQDYKDSNKLVPEKPAWNDEK